MIIKQVYHRAYAPGDRICPVYQLDIAEIMRDDRDIDYPEHAPDGKHYKHRHKRLAGAAADRRNRVRKGEQAEEQRFYTHLLCSEGDNGGIIRKQPDKLRREQKNGNTDQLAHHNGGGYPEPRTPFCAFVLLCAEVLPGEGGYCKREAVYRQEGKALELCITAVCGCRELAEGVYVRLHYNVCKPDDRALYAGGDPVAQDKRKHIPMEAQLAQAQPVRRLFSEQICKAERDGAELRYNGGKSRRPYAEPAHTDKDDIQNYIYNGRYHKVNERTAAVAHRIERAGTDIVYYHKDRAAEVYRKIFRRFRKYIRVGLHQPQQRRGKRKPGDTYGSARNNGKKHRGM